MQCLKIIEILANIYIMKEGIKLIFYKRKLYISQKLTKTKKRISEQVHRFWKSDGVRHSQQKFSSSGAIMPSIVETRVKEWRDRCKGCKHNLQDRKCNICGLILRTSALICHTSLFEAEDM